MKNKAVVIVVAVVLLVLGAGTFYLLAKDNGNESTAMTNNTENKVAKTLTVDDVVSKLRNGGVSIGEKNVPLYQMIGAVNGVEYGVADTDPLNIEIYQFDDASKIAKATEQIKGYDSTSTFIPKENILVIVHSSDETVISNIQKALQ